MKGNCGTCEAYAGLQKECRKKSPTAVVVMGPAGGPQGVMGIWPAVKTTDWCAEYRLDPGDPEQPVNPKPQALVVPH